MKTLADRLREDDPLTRDGGLTEAEASAMRRRVTGEAAAHSRNRVAWRRALAIGAAAALTAGIGVTAGRLAFAPASRSAAAAGSPDQAAERRQLQFATPGGTRVIWTFDPDFSVKETNP